MRKTILLTVLLAMLPSMLQAQQGWKGKLELSANISGEPYDLAFGDADYYVGSSDLASIYGPQKRNENYTPILSIMGEYKLKKNFSIGLEAAYAHAGNDYYDPFSDVFTGSFSKHTFALLPGVKYRYLLKKYFALHSGVSAGAALQFGKHLRCKTCHPGHTDRHESRERPLRHSRLLFGQHRLWGQVWNRLQILVS